MGRAVGAKDTGLHTGQADGTVNSYVGTGCHSQGTVSSRLHVCILRQGRCSCSQGVSCIVGDLHGHAGRNGVVAGRQSAVSGQGEHFVAGSIHISKSCIKALVQLCAAFREEHGCCGALGKNCAQICIRYGRKVISSSGADDAVGICIDPAQKLAAADRTCHQLRTAGRDSEAATGSDSSTVSFYAAQCAVVGNTNIVAGCNQLNREAGKRQRCGGAAKTVLGGHGNGIGFALCHLLANGTAGCRLVMAVNTAGDGIVKADICNTAGVVGHNNIGGCLAHQTALCGGCYRAAGLSQ